MDSGQPCAVQLVRLDLHLFGRTKATERELPAYDGRADFAAIQPGHQPWAERLGCGALCSGVSHSGVLASEGKEDALGLERETDEDVQWIEIDLPPLDSKEKV